MPHMNRNTICPTFMSVLKFSLFIQQAACISAFFLDALIFILKPEIINMQGIGNL